MIELFILIISMIISGLVCYKLGSLKQETKKLNETIDKINTANTLDILSDNDVNKLYDKYE